MRVRRAIAALLLGVLMLPAPALAGQAQPPTQRPGETPVQGNTPPQQQADPGRAEQLKEEARSLRQGRRVRVRLIDGSTRSGRVLGSAEQGITLQPTPADEPEMVEYTRIAAIETGLTTGTKVAIGAGIAAAIALAAVAAN